MIDGKDQSRRGLLWLGSAAILARVMDVGATLAVVSLLSRQDMGLAALALSACAVLESLSGLGVGSALIQANDVSAREESSLFWLTGGIGLGLGAVLALLGPLLAHIYAEPELVSLTVFSSLKLLFIGLSVVPMQLLSKNLKFKEVGAVQTLSSLAEGLVKIAFALAGAGAWALVVGNVARGVALVAALWLLSEFRPRLHFAAAEAARFLRFGLHVAGSSILFQFYKNADYFLVGKFLGIEPLGLYRVAFDVAMQPTDAINAVMGRVGFPVYARLRHDLAALRAAFVSNTRSLLLMVTPVAVYVFFAATDLLSLIGGGRWVAAAAAVHVLVIAGLLRAATVIFSQVYMAVGRPQLSTLDSAVTLVVLVVAFCVGLVLFPELGILSVCYAWLFAYPLFLCGHLLLSRRFVGLAPFAYLRALAAALGSVVPMALAAFAAKRLLASVQLPALTLGVLALVVLAFHAGYLRWVLKVRWRELVPRRASSNP